MIKCCGIEIFFLYTISVALKSYERLVSEKFATGKQEYIGVILTFVMIAHCIRTQKWNKVNIIENSVVVVC
jgi:hypothetical protein